MTVGYAGGAVPYQVVWRWTWDSGDEYPRVDDVMTTDAKRAISKVYRSLAEEYAMTRRDFQVLEVYRI